MSSGDLYAQVLAKYEHLLEITQSMLEISAAQKEILEQKDYNGLFSLFSQLEKLRSRYEMEMADLERLSELEYQLKQLSFKQEHIQGDCSFTPKARLVELKSQLQNDLQKLQLENQEILTLLQSRLPQVREDISLVRKGLKMAGAYRETMHRKICRVDLYE